MKKNETISEIIIRLAKEYDFSGKTQKDEEDGSVYEGTSSAVVLEWNCEDEEWFARMTNGGSVTHIFWDGKNNEDSYIDIETVRDNARIYGVSWLNEMRRVVVHGVLHLCGQKDKTPRANAQMHRKEDKYLKFWQL